MRDADLVSSEAEPWAPNPSNWSEWSVMEALLVGTYLRYDFLVPGRLARPATGFDGTASVGLPRVLLRRGLVRWKQVAGPVQDIRFELPRRGGGNITNARRPQPDNRCGQLSPCQRPGESTIPCLRPSPGEATGTVRPVLVCHETSPGRGRGIGRPIPLRG
jgi:hypothetical protein